MPKGDNTNPYRAVPVLETCIDCGVEWEHSFKRRSQRCAPCRLEWRRKGSSRWAKDNRERANARQREWIQRNPARRRAYSRKALYGLSEDQYAAMLESQAGRCAICGVLAEDAPKGHLFVDHAHSTGIVRGLLCHDCNIGIGQLREDPFRFESAMHYLKERL